MARTFKEWYLVLKRFASTTLGYKTVHTTDLTQICKRQRCIAGFPFLMTNPTSGSVLAFLDESFHTVICDFCLSINIPQIKRLQKLHWKNLLRNKTFHIHSFHMELHENANSVNQAWSVIVLLHPHRMGENIDLASVDLQKACSVVSNYMLTIFLPTPFPSN